MYVLICPLQLKTAFRQSQSVESKFYITYEKLMPLDGHSFLVAQGWGGKGTGLRQGGISRPLAIPQKKTLAGLGKDRDEAFPFWDQYVDACLAIFVD